MLDLLLRPATLVMSRLRVPAKLAVIGALLLLPAAWATWTLVVQSWQAVSGLQREAAAGELVIELGQLSLALQQVRDETARVQAGEASASSGKSLGMLPPLGVVEQVGLEAEVLDILRHGGRDAACRQGSLDHQGLTARVSDGHKGR